MSTQSGASSGSRRKAGGRRPMTFDVGVGTPYAPWGGLESMDRAVKLADEVGIFGVNLGDRLVTPSNVPTVPSGTVFYDMFVLGSHIATLTRRLHIVYGVMNVTLRPAVVTAKLLATLDVVAQGRLVVGVGVGMSAAEGWADGRGEGIRVTGDLEVTGVPAKERGALADEYLKAMKVLWTQDRPTFEGKYVSFRDIEFYPKPVQKPHPPIWVGGTSPRALRRVVELGDGLMVGGTPEVMAERMARVRELASARGRDPSTIGFSCSLGVGPRPKKNVYGVGYALFPEPAADTPERAIDLLGRYRDLGISHISLKFAWETPKDFMDRTEWFAAKVMPAFQ